MLPAAWGAAMVLLILAVLLGSTGIAPWRIVAMFIAGPSSVDPLAAVVWHVRLPRALVVALVGAALGASGAALQTAFRNPLADPGILGLSSGGSLAAVLCLLLMPDRPSVVPLAALAGALGSGLVLGALAGGAAGRSRETLLLAGVALGGLWSALVGLALLVSGEHEVRRLVFWLAGGAEARSWEHLVLAAPFVAMGILVLKLLQRPLDALGVGDDEAASVGVDPSRARRWVVLGVGLCVAGAVSACGPVGFVGLAVPHMVRPLVGAGSGRLLPASALGGALLLLSCDLVLRTVLPPSIQLGTLTALLGAPFFLGLLVRLRRGGDP